VRVLSRRDCRRFLRAIDIRPQPPLDWEKGAAATSRAYYEIATRDEILGVVSELLDGEVILWGASMQTRVPNAVHPWHSDIESSDPEWRTVSVWIGLEHTSPESSLLVLSYSHRFGATVQRVRHENGKDRDGTSLDDLVGWAHERDSRGELVRLCGTSVVVSPDASSLSSTAVRRSRPPRRASPGPYSKSFATRAAGSGRSGRW
jgi:hypothetical protein